MWFSFRERGEEAWLCLGCLPIKHDVCCLRFLCMCSTRYYRWKWLEGHTTCSSAPQNTILRSSHSYTDFVAWFARIITGKHLCTVIWDAHFKLRFATWFGMYTHGLFCVFWILIQNAHLELKFKIRTLPSCENSLCLIHSVIILILGVNPLFKEKC